MSEKGGEHVEHSCPKCGQIDILPRIDPYFIVCCNCGRGQDKEPVYMMESIEGEIIAEEGAEIEIYKHKIGELKDKIKKMEARLIHMEKDSVVQYDCINELRDEIAQYKDKPFVPTEPGCYWYKGLPYSEWQIVSVRMAIELYAKFFDEEDEDIKNMKGDWLPDRILMPGEE